MKEERKLWREEGKKTRNFGPPTLRGDTLRCTLREVGLAQVEIGRSRSRSSNFEPYEHRWRQIFEIADSNDSPDCRLGHPTCWILTRYLRHADGKTSHERRWQRPYASPSCIFGETVVYAKQTNVLPKHATRFNSRHLGWRTVRRFPEGSERCNHETLFFAKTRKKDVSKSSKSQKRPYGTTRTSDGRCQSPRTWKVWPRPRQGRPDAPATTMRETWQH